MDLHKLIKEEYNSILKENLQLANKVYFNTGLLSNEDKENILAVTNGDHFTKIISDIYYYNKENNKSNDKLIEYYEQLKNYNKNILPLKGFDIYKTNKDSISNVIEYLNARKDVIQFLNILPSTAKRNLKNELRKERDINQIIEILNDIIFIEEQLEKLYNKDEEVINKILNKAFKSNVTMNYIVDFFEDKTNLIQNNKISKEDILEILKTCSSSKLKYDKGKVVVIETKNPDDLKKLSCNSLWCYSDTKNYISNFNDYSYNGIIYLIFDFSHPVDVEGFSYTIIKPPKMFEDVESDYFDDEEEYNEQNVYMYNHFNDKVDLDLSYFILYDMFGGMKNVYKIFNFK